MKLCNIDNFEIDNEVSSQKNINLLNLDKQIDIDNFNNSENEINPKIEYNNNDNHLKKGKQIIHSKITS